MYKRAHTFFVNFPVRICNLKSDTVSCAVTDDESDGVVCVWFSTFFAPYNKNVGLIRVIERYLSPNFRSKGVQFVL